MLDILRSQRTVLLMASHLLRVRRRLLTSALFRPSPHNSRSVWGLLLWKPPDCSPLYLRLWQFDMQQCSRSQL